MINFIDQFPCYPNTLSPHSPNQLICPTCTNSLKQLSLSFQYFKLPNFSFSQLNKHLHLIITKNSPKYILIRLLLILYLYIFVELNYTKYFSNDQISKLTSKIIIIYLILWLKFKIYSLFTLLSYSCSAQFFSLRV